MKLGEIIGVNSNGIESVKEVLTQCDIGNSRQWVRVDCDGVPYAIADKCINRCLVCAIGNEQMSCNAIETHFEEQHPRYAIQYDKLFNSILLVPSTGHTEINLMRALFQICRPDFMELLAEQLRFCSKRAVEYIVTCRNHHLSWQIVVIVLYSFALELIKMYVLTCYERQKKPSLTEYVLWRSKVINPNYNLYYDLTFSMFLAIKCFRSEVRKNNSKFILASRRVASSLFYVGKHRIYQSLIIRDL